MASNNIFATETLTGATFTDGSVLSGSWLVEYTAAGAFVALIQDSFTLTSSTGTSTAHGMAARRPVREPPAPRPT